MKCETCGTSKGDMHNTGLNNTGTWYCEIHYWKYLQEDL